MFASDNHQAILDVLAEHGSPMSVAELFEPVSQKMKMKRPGWRGAVKQKYFGGVVRSLAGRGQIAVSDDTVSLPEWSAP